MSDKIPFVLIQIYRQPTSSRCHKFDTLSLGYSWLDSLCCYWAPSQFPQLQEEAADDYEIMFLSTAWRKSIRYPW